MNQTTKGERMHIGIFGKRNAGKSSLINAISNQDIALVSETPGTTTDPVYKAMEILPIGPVMFIDTAGLDDTGELGEKRVKKSLEVLRKCDYCLIVVSSSEMDSEIELEKQLIGRLKEQKIPSVLVINKTDVQAFDPRDKTRLENELGISVCTVSAKTRSGIDDLKKLIYRGFRCIMA